MKPVVYLILFLFANIAFAQEITPANVYAIKALESNNDYRNQNANLFVQNNNIVKIMQIGAYNAADVSVISNNSNVALNQIGNNNYINMYKKAPEVNQSVVQSGNNNMISDFSLYSSGAINMSINQRGDNLTIFNNGSNSISEGMKITQTGNSGTIYIFNH
ncbi:hypothetical protein [Flavobacterium hydatis]|uniref:Curlin n=1 Tax=Flavobacterium hydatis TaxID=991 RepID=A0A086AB00_FLAHY|nr:hypothetical protein [Flavobacterium hydatis]KFF13864.1 hypothetical protein IW20_17490 [Flavobacterium hydatis]OXA89497.1 hypothetical protein B0A62_20745 [Flavobacterium hydatis]